MIQRICWIVMVNLVLYYRTLLYGYIGDDIERSQRQDIKPRNRLHKQWYQFISERHWNSMHSHLYSLLVHTFVCVMVYIAFGHSDVSFWAAILFSVNPVNMFNSIWLSGRLYSISALLSLFMLWIPLLTPILYYIGSYTAINLMFVPLMFIKTQIWWLVFTIPIIHLINRRYIVNVHNKVWKTTIKTTNKEMRSIHPRKFILLCKNYAYYFCLCLFPVRVGCDHEFLYGFGTNKIDNKKGYKIDKWFIGGLLLGLSVLFFYLSTELTLLSFGLWWFSINILMWCNYITIQQQIAQRYAYLANIGLMVALASVISGYPIALTVFIVYYIARTWHFMPAFQNDYWMVEYTIHEFPKFHYIWVTRGVKKHSTQDFRGAFYDFGEAYQHKPYDFKVCFDLMVSLLIIGDIKGAKEFAQKVKQNIYDEGETEALPNINYVVRTIEECEKMLKSGTTYQLDGSKIIVVK